MLLKDFDFMGIALLGLLSVLHLVDASNVEASSQGGLRYRKLGSSRVSVPVPNSDLNALPSQNPIPLPPVLTTSVSMGNAHKPTINHRPLIHTNPKHYDMTNVLILGRQARKQPVKHIHEGSFEKWLEAQQAAQNQHVLYSGSIVSGSPHLDLAQGLSHQSETPWQRIILAPQTNAIPHSPVITRKQKEKSLSWIERQKQLDDPYPELSGPDLSTPYLVIDHLTHMLELRIANTKQAIAPLIKPSANRDPAMEGLCEAMEKTKNGLPMMDYISMILCNLNKPKSIQLMREMYMHVLHDVIETHIIFTESVESQTSMTLVEEAYTRLFACYNHQSTVLNRPSPLKEDEFGNYVRAFLVFAYHPAVPTWNKIGPFRQDINELANKGLVAADKQHARNMLFVMREIILILKAVEITSEARRRNGQRQHKTIL